MSPTTPAVLATHDDVQRQPPGRRVVDAPTRMFHWLLAVSFTGAWLTAEVDGLETVHTALGYSMAGLLVFRLLYGLLGPRQVRLSAMFARASGLPAWLQRAWQSMRTLGRPGQGAAPAVNWSQGLGIAAGAIAVTMLLLIAPLVLSGLGTLDEWGGHRVAEMTEEVHEFAANLLLGLVLAHLASLVVLSLLRRRNEAARMFTGRVSGPGPDIARRNHAWLAALLLAGVLGYWGWEALQAFGPAAL